MELSIKVFQNPSSVNLHELDHPCCIIFQDIMQDIMQSLMANHCYGSFFKDSLACIATCAQYRLMSTLAGIVLAWPAGCYAVRLWIISQARCCAAGY